MFEIRYAEECDKDFWFTLDHGLPKEEFANKVRDQQVYLLLENNKKIGVLRYNYFWDTIPFLTLIYIDWSYHKKGYGRKAMEYWESEMIAKGYEQPLEMFMIKTLK